MLAGRQSVKQHSQNETACRQIKCHNAQAVFVHSRVPRQFWLLTPPQYAKAVLGSKVCAQAGLNFINHWLKATLPTTPLPSERPSLLNCLVYGPSMIHSSNPHPLKVNLSTTSRHFFFNTKQTYHCSLQKTPTIYNNWTPTSAWISTLLTPSTQL